jgi:hypothetical protein
MGRRATIYISNETMARLYNPDRGMSRVMAATVSRYRDVLTGVMSVARAIEVEDIDAQEAKVNG